MLYNLITLATLSLGAQTILAAPAANKAGTYTNVSLAGGSISVSDPTADPPKWT